MDFNGMRKDWTNLGAKLDPRNITMSEDVQKHWHNVNRHKDGYVYNHMKAMDETKNHVDRNSGQTKGFEEILGASQGMASAAKRIAIAVTGAETKEQKAEKEQLQRERENNSNLKKMASTLGEMKENQQQQQLPGSAPSQNPGQTPGNVTYNVNVDNSQPVSHASGATATAKAEATDEKNVTPLSRKARGLRAQPTSMLPEGLADSGRNNEYTL